MSFTPEQLLKIAINYSVLAVKQLKKTAVDVKQPENFGKEFHEWLKKNRKDVPTTVREMPAVKLPVTVREMPAAKMPTELVENLAPKYDPGPFSPPKIRIEDFPMGDDISVEDLDDANDESVKTAKDKKLDPKAKVRNRGTVCVPAESAKDKKDHFPINDEGQARNALARVHQYSSAPAWYKGSLKSLQELVSRKVHSKYKGIGKSEKKSSVENLISKYASPQEFARLVSNYDTGALLVRDFAQGMKESAKIYAGEANLDDPSERKTYDILLKQISLVERLIPEMQVLDHEMHGDDASMENLTEASIDNLIEKYSG
jgi:hypothetical protein